MIAQGERVLGAAGGKDFLVWDLLLDAGYAVDGLYIGLGIGDTGRSGTCPRLATAGRSASSRSI
jgi:hypothetical protein